MPVAHTRRVSRQGQLGEADMSKAVQARLEAPGPKRMLALDGGGVRGIITLAFLEHVEQLLAKRSKNPEAFRLSDYFDLIGGTSVGSITAVLLAMGYKVSEVTEIFFDWIPEIFANPLVSVPVVRPRFDARKLTNRIRGILRDRPLETDDLKTGFAIMAKRVDTGSPWILTNNPKSAYWEDKPPTIGNRHYRLAELIRASTAAPYYFSPTTIRIHEDEVKPGVFVDGGVSPHNSPALQMLLLAQLKGYNFNWVLGENNLLLISVGTGTYRVRVADSVLNRNVSALHAVDALQGVISDSQSLNLTLLQMLSKPRRRWTINSEIDDQRDDPMLRVGGVDHPLLSFTRYDVKLEKPWLSAKLGRNFSDRRLNQIRDFMDPTDLRTNYNLGHQAAEYQVTPDDFPGAFDI
jgi:hypothetical protein